MNSVSSFFSELFAFWTFPSNQINILLYFKIFFSIICIIFSFGLSPEIVKTKYSGLFLHLEVVFGVSEDLRFKKKSLKHEKRFLLRFIWPDSVDSKLNSLNLDSLNQSQDNWTNIRPLEINRKNFQLAFKAIHYREAHPHKRP